MDADDSGYSGDHESWSPEQLIFSHLDFFPPERHDWLKKTCDVQLCTKDGLRVAAHRVCIFMWYALSPLSCPKTACWHMC